MDFMAKRRKKNSSLKNIICHLFIPRRSNNHRSKVLHPDALFLVFLISMGFFALIRFYTYLPVFKKNVLGYSSNITIESVIEKTNLERQKYGLSSLVFNQTLASAAESKATDMFNKQYWAHTSPDGTEPWDFIIGAGYTYKVAGENLARDFSNSQDMMNAWMASPTHKANILNDQYTEIGIAVVDGKLEGFETTLVVQMFGKPAETSSIVLNAESSAHDKLALSSKKVQEELATSYKSPQLSSSVINSPLINPLQITKAVFLSIVIMIVFTLIYDGVLSQNYNTIRIVGNNLAHIILFMTVAFLLIFFKGGMVK